MSGPAAALTIRASRTGSRLLATSAQRSRSLSPSLASAQLHTHVPNYAPHQREEIDWEKKRWEIPKRLEGIPDAENPNFFNMVEYYFHKACVLAEDQLLASLHRWRYKY